MGIRGRGRGREEEGRAGTRVEEAGARLETMWGRERV